MGDVRDLRSAPSVRRAERQTPSFQDEMVLRAEPRAPRAVRHWVMRTIAGLGVTGAANQVVELLTAELVSNAVVHGPEGGEIRVQLRVAGSSVRVEVQDTGHGSPTVRHPELTAPSGRGLALVEALSGSWGTRPDESGTSVWFEVDADA
ncbi:ATP-binding protein [Cellulomonas edaphi]|uniref:ATP-binding protein n=1 Tax=Cellulomonas edaphi TaxID=3053468 RepID=A0ABT7S454_9CELL|nr:ATP-binding protein [Cellulomons edaphi]MDM7830400.1 ATP-binding protein [Cellulomons edaphi]